MDSTSSLTGLTSLQQISQQFITTFLVHLMRDQFSLPLFHSANCYVFVFLCFFIAILSCRSGGIQCTFPVLDQGFLPKVCGDLMDEVESNSYIKTDSSCSDLQVHVIDQARTHSPLNLQSIYFKDPQMATKWPRFTYDSFQLLSEAPGSFGLLSQCNNMYPLIIQEISE